MGTNRKNVANAEKGQRDKKIIIIVAVLIIIGLLLGGISFCVHFGNFERNSNVSNPDTFSVYAAENQSDAAPLYIRSISCPSEYVDYASENVSKFINPLEITNPNNVSLGTPFSFAEADADVFYFPVFDSEKMKFLLRVYPDGEGYSAVLSAFLVDEIESLAPLTSPENPLNLLMADNTIIAMIGENSYTLFEYPLSMGCDSSTYSLSKEPDYHTIDAKQITQSVNMKQTRDVYTLID